MLISYKWLKGYFEDGLPEAEKLAEILSYSFAEIESISKISDDKILDIKVLPDRACYALSHRGVAYEISAILGIAKNEMNWPEPEIKEVREVPVEVLAENVVNRYMVRVIENINPKASTWAKEHLEAIGQRSINTVVDGVNIVMFDMGQPLHVFDADKVDGGIVVRYAKEGEKITTLDNKEVDLDESVLVIADHKDVLALAGIKGGKKAEVTADTKNLILESANFEASYIRRASDKLGIKTDSSKRFENQVPADYAEIGMSNFSSYLLETDKSLSAGKVVDWYPEPVEKKEINISTQFITDKLGMKLGVEEIKKILRSLLIEVSEEGGNLVVTPPIFRKDLNIKEDIVEEVGRIVGFEKIEGKTPANIDKKIDTPKQFYYEWKIREILSELGFSEILTSSFSSQGDLEILKPLASDKRFARKNIKDSFEKALNMNGLNSPLFSKDFIKNFEIGNVFSESGESVDLAIGFSGPKKKSKEEMKKVREVLKDKIGIEFDDAEDAVVIECALNKFIEKLPEISDFDVKLPELSGNVFREFSNLPFIVRDVALFVGVDDSPEDVFSIIKESAGELLVNSWMFDRFEKEGRLSLAYSLVFQSKDRTLTDEEINSQMEEVYDALRKKSFEIR